jgi:hypothetical protein
MTENDTEQNTAMELVEPASAIAEIPSTTVQINQTNNADMLMDFLAMAREDIEVRKQETTLRGKEIDNAHAYSMEALTLQAQDLKDGRGFTQSTRRDYLWTAGAVLLAIVAFLIYCLQTGHEEIAMKIITYGGTSAASVISGYFYGKSKAQSKDSESQQE